MTLAIILISSIILVALAMAGLAINLLIKKEGKFPNTHVGGNRYLRQQGISCAQTQDRIEQANIKKQVDFKTMKLLVTK